MEYFRTAVPSATIPALKYHIIIILSTKKAPYGCFVTSESGRTRHVAKRHVPGGYVTLGAEDLRCGLDEGLGALLLIEKLQLRLGTTKAPLRPERVRFGL